MSVIKKKKHVSKKNKKDWRKHCDIRDVEDFLEDQRLDERLGKFETKPDSELFVVDTGGETTKPEDTVVKPLSAKLKKRQKLAETPKCFEILIPSSKVQDPNAKRNHVKPIGSAPTALSKITDKRRFEKGAYQRKLDQARSNRRTAYERKKKDKNARQTFDADLWNGQELPLKGIPETLCDEFISPEAQNHNVLPTHRLRPKPAAPKTVVERAAIEIPHPGISYNPTYQEHRALLQEVVVHEQKMIKKEQHLHRVTTKMFRKMTPTQQQSQWLEEMSVGLPTPHNPAEDSASDTEYKPVNPPVKNKKKDHKARRKQRERLEEKERIKRAKVDKKKIADLYRLRKLQSSIHNSSQLQATRKTAREARRASQAATAAPALNAHSVPPAEPELVAPEDLCGELRSVGGKGNLLRDRFLSLQRRGALAASKVMMKKNKKTKAYFKPGHKVTDQDIQRYLNRTPGKV